MSEAFYRKWLMLENIPRHPQKISTTALYKKLIDEGGNACKRTIERDLEALREFFPYDRRKINTTKYWFWPKMLAPQNLPGIDPATALAFKIAESYLKPLLPTATFRLLQPYFEQAKKVFEKKPDNRLNKWSDKIAVIDRGLVLKKPVIDHEVQQVIYEALMHEKQIDAKYRKRDATVADQYQMQPLGIVSQQNVIYLVCVIKDRENIRHLPLHRFESAKIIENPYDRITISDQFDLNTYINNENTFQYKLSPDPINLKVLLEARAAVRLYETPISDDQTLTKQEDDRVLLKATVAHTMALEWWLQEFGANAEVVAPVELREKFISTVKELNEMYQI